ncbi:DUF1003 domain-containing protein [Rhizobium sp. SL86]|uniref:DUF1003 domain-containing protein n=1 Tax=Rhizobium sp. SL86 TaxID=2995148 RepID=UPI00227399E4|nr:DUF1003 domain-containing protein [Rhizobium sp. SL86]MCY1666433.1 DUF1003 domain-containing protein [Rhizobium sp. SL86]
MTRTLDRNIDVLVERTKHNLAKSGRQERAADAITRFAGSMVFVYLHLAFFGAWIAINTGILPILRPFDPSLVVLAMIASVEAIFLSTFVLISQNRMSAADDKRADLNLQISLLHEHETTRLIALVSELARKLDVSTDVDREIEELKRDVQPERVMERIEERGESLSQTDA